MTDFLPLFGFVFFGLFSPGPNVILITTSGARFGFQRTIPHILGVVVGVGVIAFVTGIGVGALINAVPALEFVLKVIASLWILWMAYTLWQADPAKRKETDKPFTFLQAVLFQWVNPKVWAVALSAMVYVPEMTTVAQAATLAGTFSTTNLGVCTFWAVAGTLLSYLLKNPVAWRIFMRIMALALAGFSVLVFL
ncbi:MAG: LysE family translocator [Pseudomonadota bacterium]